MLKNTTNKFAAGAVLFVALLPMWLLVRGVTGIIKKVEVSPLPFTSAMPFNSKVLSCAGETVYDKVVEFTPLHIVATNAEVDLDIAPVALENGTWDVYEGVANYAQETSKVSNIGGNVGVYAHNKIPGFEKIINLKTGDTVELYGGNYKATYQVTETKTDNPEAVDVFYPTEESVLTLVTCGGAFSEKRYILQAKLSHIEELNCVN